MSIASITPLSHQLKKQNSKIIPLGILLKLNTALNKTIFNRKFYQEINDKVLASTTTVDVNLYFICYFTLLLSSVCNNKPKIKQYLSKQRYNLIQLINSFTLKAFNKDLKSSSNKTISKLFSISNPDLNPASTTDGDKPVSQLAVHLKAISSYLSDIRIFSRLTDSIKYMPWIIDEYYAFVSSTSTTPKFDRFINLLQSLNCLVLELLENAGWLTDHNWVGTSDNNYWCIETYIWCSRVWGAYLIIEIIELIRRTPIKNWDKNWKVNLFKQVIQIPLVLHWSLYDGCLTPFWVGVCGSGASWWGFKEMWSSLELK